MDLNFDLHEKQLEVFTSLARFRVCAAGRRGGKSYLSAVELLIHGMQTVNGFGRDIKDKEVWYIAPTFQQAKDIMWNLIKTIGEPLIERTLENTATLILKNGRRIQLKGSDRPDTLRGVGISFVVLDEYAFMKPEVWDMIIRATLADVKGSALFIGTPEGKNHFYDLWKDADEMDNWEAFQFNSTDNPIIDVEEVEEARKVMSAAAFRQEFEASFEAAGGGSFTQDMIKYAEAPETEGITYITVDPAGFGEGDGMTKSKLNRLDECAISVVDVSPSGWFVRHIEHGRWGVRETSLRIVRLAQRYRPAALGIESGSLKNAIMPYLEDQMRRLGVYPNVVPLTHGGKKKTERILWALQGRFQHGKVTLMKDATWNKHFVDQLLDFPNPLAHDDLLDSLSYIDQISAAVYDTGFVPEEWEPTDEQAGY